MNLFRVLGGYFCREGEYSSSINCNRIPIPPRRTNEAWFSSHKKVTFLNADTTCS